MEAKRVFMIVAIAVLFSLFIGLLLDAVYPGPKYEDFCENDYGYFPSKIDPRGSDDCKYIQTEEEKQCYKDGGFYRYDYNESGCITGGKCDFCNKEFNDVNEKYNRNIFLILVPISLIAILFGVYFFIDFIGLGFMFGGLLLLAYATTRFLGQADKVTRVIVIGVELLIVLWLGYKKIYKKKN
ncbi:MAG: hypothetical protein HYS32_01120 [Candidatus Woesearchaeota archaeon]|nr:MAG: hypothetical protein HYS32_01120 [Candidatus Woesearchaeota archaeon]